MKKQFIDGLTIELMQEGISLWELANKLGVHYNTLVNWRHKGLTNEQQGLINNAIAEIKKEGVRQ